MPILNTADLVDTHDEHLTFCDYPLTRFGRQEGFHGPIATLKCFEDNSLVRSTLEQAGDGRVLVVDGGGSTRCALVGDQIAQLAKDNGWAGIVINGSIRDSEIIGDMEFAIFALATSPKKSSKTGMGTLAQPINFGDATFVDGHYLYADGDGILVAPAAVHG
ncbi:ribonuclease E activity regulator RraA [Devosia sp. 2618]|uniref:ribonuclease E activity regulator RraA n=1 Tax=Devosia sp. 2618 TaxID=3156454 RepID=UPI003393D2B5